MYEREGAWSVLQRGSSADPAIWPTISPDGRWLAYSARDAGNWQVFVRPLLEDGPTQQVSVGTGSMPAWSADGSELIYMTYVDNQTGPRDCMAVTVTEASGRLQLSRPVKLFTEPSPSGYVHGAPVRAWDIAPDGRFIFLKTPPLEQQHEFFNSLYPDRLRIIYSWASTLGR